LRLREIERMNAHAPAERVRREEPVSEATSFPAPAVGSQYGGQKSERSRNNLSSFGGMAVTSPSIIFAQFTKP